MNTIHSIRGRLAIVAIAAMMLGSMLGSATLDSAEAGKKNGHNAKDFAAVVVALLDARVCTAEAEDGTATQFVCNLVAVNVQNNNINLLNHFLNKNNVNVEVLNFNDVVDVNIGGDVIDIDDVLIVIADVLDIDIEEVNICGVIVGVASIILVECRT